MRFGRPSWRGAGALRYGADASGGPNHSDQICFNACRLLFYKRAAEFWRYKPLLYLENCTLVLPREVGRER
jgi:hypothetical protein